MKKIVLIPPDVSVPSYVYVLIVFGMVIGVGACISLVAGLSSLCGTLPFISASAALVALFPWSLRNVRSAGRFSGRRTALVLVAFAMVSALAAILCLVHR